jgi:hypothetical protein
MNWTLALTKLQPRLTRMCFVTFLANLIALPSGTFEGLPTTTLISRLESDFLAIIDARESWEQAVIEGDQAIMMILRKHTDSSRKSLRVRRHGSDARTGSFKVARS